MALFLMTIAFDNPLTFSRRSFPWESHQISAGFIKHTVLSCFYEYAISRNFINHSPLPTNLPKRPPAFIPYIYTRAELHQLFKAAYKRLWMMDKKWRHLGAFRTFGWEKLKAFDKLIFLSLPKEAQ